MKCFSLGSLCAPLLVALGLALVISPPTAAGTLIVSGDVTSAFSLTNSSPNVAQPGVGQFYTNILGGGTSVAILSSNQFDASDEIDEFYDSLTGVSTNLFSSEITPGLLSGVDLLLLPFLGRSLSAAEVDAIAAFQQSGGTLFVTGEGASINGGANSNGLVNSLLSDLGSSMSIVSVTLDIGPQTATGTEIADHPLTSGVTTFHYGATASVAGGTPLFFANDGTSAFMAVEVPEPLTATLAIACLLATVGARRRG